MDLLICYPASLGWPRNHQPFSVGTLHTQTHCDSLSMWSLRDLCSNEMHTGLYLVRATALKQRLEAAAVSTANKLLDQIQTMARDSNDHICETYTHMAAGVSMVWHVD